VTAAEWAFAVMAVVGSIAAIRMVTAKNVVHAALYLVVTLLSVGGVYLVLAAEFVAWVQILIYVGAIVILFLFGLMLTKAPIGRDSLDNQQRVVALVVALGVLAGLILLLNGAFDWSEPANRIRVAETDTQAVGSSLFRSYVLPFEAISLLLLAALIGAIVLARKDDAR
jgi:NADH-quinone oxidoreductase subunit J